MTTAIIYTRFSPRPDAKECDSCKKQLERCKAYCKRKGHIVLASYSDEAITGGIFDRPWLAAAIENLREVDSEKVLVVDSVNRLARDMLVTLTIRHEVERAGGRIEYADGTPTTTTPEGELFSNILAAFAAYERSRIRHATSRGIKRRQANGEWFGRPPVGWMRDPENSKKLIPCEQEQAAIEYAKSIPHFYTPAGAIRECATSAEIAEILTERFGPFRGRPWSARTVRRILAQQASE